jgi:radical SAM superfamily enzyme YgiQ (UPF0313 family)
MPSIYIINPAHDAASYHSAEAYVPGDGAGWALIGDLAIVTVAALVPAGWDIRIVDEIIHPVDLDAEVDFVAITGKISQRSRMYALADEFRRRGRTVLIGGCFASLNADDVRPHADILVTGELEELAPQLFADLAAGTWADRYDGGRPAMRASPLPRWDLYPLERVSCGAVQTARGCPFECEFCDVIQYQGRKQRHKETAQILAELDVQYARGCRRIFLVDDNFTVHRRRAHALLEDLARWNEAHADDPVKFWTQASLDVARDPELLAACAAAGLTTMFIGIESVNADSLRETGKRQNLLQPMQTALETIVRHGIGIQGGIVVGFDHDGPDIFEHLFAAVQKFPVPELTIGCLVAYRSTPLYARLKREGRLLGDVWDGNMRAPFWTNFRPARMTRDELIDGTLWLTRKVYAPEHFRTRMLNFIDAFGDDVPAPRRTARVADGRLPSFQKSLRTATARGPAEAEMVMDVLRAASRKPACLQSVATFVGRYEQFRLVLDDVPAAGGLPRSGASAVDMAALPEDAAPGTAAVAL